MGSAWAETTPGPLIMVLQFVGFMAAFRDPGALPPMLARHARRPACNLGDRSTPCFLWIFLGAPFVEVLRGNKALNGALSAITAAVVGVVLNLAIWFAIHTLFREVRPVRDYGLAFEAPLPTSVDPWALALSVAAAVAIFRFKTGMIPTLSACCAAGIVPLSPGTPVMTLRGTIMTLLIGAVVSSHARRSVALAVQNQNKH